jgi:DNA polymerase delta subunit 2
MQKDEELLNATASDPLSLEEEYAMQEEWRVDPRSTFFGIQDSVTFEIYFLIE